MVTDWKEYSFVELCSVQIGLTHTPTYVSLGVPFLSVKDLADGELDFNDVKYISQEEYKVISDSAKPQKGDIVFGRVGTLGNPCIVNTDIDFAIFVSLGYLRAKDWVLNSFIYQWLKSDRFYKLVEEKIAGSSQKNLNTGWLKEFCVQLPPLLEQKRIAEALSDVDVMISSLEKLIEKKKAIKQGAMQDLLTGKKRLPGFTGDWEKRTLNEISTEMVDGPFGSDLKSEHYTSDRQVRIIQLSNIGETGWGDENTKYTTFAHAKELSRCIVKPGSLLIAKMMPAGRAILCPDREKGYILGSDVVKLVPSSSIDRRYLVYATKSQLYLDQISEDIQGSTRSRTSISKLRKTSIWFPSKLEQNAIASVLSNMDSEIEELEQKLNKTRKLKQGMMQQLLTGKIRLI